MENKASRMNLAPNFLWASHSIFVLKIPETKILNISFNKDKRQHKAGISSHGAPPHFKKMRVLYSLTFPKTAALLLDKTHVLSVCLDVAIYEILKGA